MLTLALASVLVADGVHCTFVPSGATAKAGGYRPIRAAMTTTQPKSVKTLPSGLSNPRFGQFVFGTKSIDFVLAGNKMFVDANRNGNLTDDPAAPLQLNEKNKVMSGTAKVDIGRGAPVGVNYYHFDESDPNRAQLKDTMLYYGDFGFQVELTLNGVSGTSFVAGDIDKTSTIWVDRNKDGRQSYFHEIIQVGKPFNFTGTTYVLNPASDGLALAKADKELPMDPMPPDFSVGKQVLSFKAKTLGGQDVDFPSTYKGKVVLLDFWATWCGPCLAEMPNVVKAYEKFHSKGFEILGITFDQEKAESKIAETAKKFNMTWDHVYEGKYWNTTIGTQFDVASIPFGVLVDGTTGQILASGDSLRGEGLSNALAAKLGS